MPAGDIGVGGREIGYLFGQYKRLTGLYERRADRQGPVLRRLSGPHRRPPATACATLSRRCCRHERQDPVRARRVVISGSGNVAIYACEKATELGAKVVAMSDSNGYIYDKDGIELDVVKQIKEVERGRIKEYAAARSRMPNITRAAGASGPFPATSPCPAPPRTSWMRKRAKALIAERLSLRWPRAPTCPPPLEATRAVPAERRPLCPRQGGQRRRRGHQRAGDEPEQHASELDVRRGGREAEGHHGEHFCTSVPKPRRNTATSPRTTSSARTLPVS